MLGQMLPANVVKFQRVLQKMARVTVAQKQLGGKVRRENEVCKLPVSEAVAQRGLRAQ